MYDGRMTWLYKPTHPLTEEEAQAVEDNSAMRILTCVRRGCRRERRCLAYGGRTAVRCAMEDRLPLPEDLEYRFLDDFKAILVRCMLVHNGEITREDHEIFMKEYEAQETRRTAIAFERAEKTLGLKPGKQKRRQPRRGAKQVEGDSLPTPN